MRPIYSLRAVVPNDAALGPERPIAILDRHRVKPVRIGAAVARLQRFPHMMADADNTPARGTTPQARYGAYAEAVPEGLPFGCSAAALGRAELCNLVTPMMLRRDRR